MSEQPRRDQSRVDEPAECSIGGRACGAEGPDRERARRIVLELFERYYERVYGFARRSVDASAAEDVAQEVFTRLLKQPGLETKSISVSYLIKVADNLIKRRYRRVQRDQRLVAERASQHGVRAVSETPAAPAGAGRSESGERVERGLGLLSKSEREALDLIVCRGLSYEQAARSLGVQVTSVNNWKFRGIKRLRQHAAAPASGREAGGEDVSGRVSRGGGRQRAG